MKKEIVEILIERGFGKRQAKSLVNRNNGFIRLRIKQGASARDIAEDIDNDYDDGYTD